MILLKQRKHIDPSKSAFARATAIRTSPQKLALVAGLIRGLNVNKAYLQLQFSKKKVAKDINHVLNSAVANAEFTKGLDIDRLYISEIFVGKAFTLKRFQPRGRGRGVRILKPFSNITIIVSEGG